MHEIVLSVDQERKRVQKRKHMTISNNQHQKTFDIDSVTVIEEIKHHVRTIMNGIAVSAMIINDTIIHSQLDNLNKANDLMQEIAERVKIDDADSANNKRLSRYYQMITGEIVSEHQKVLANINDQLLGINRIISIIDNIQADAAVQRIFE